MSRALSLAIHLTPQLRHYLRSVVALFLQDAMGVGASLTHVPSLPVSLADAPASRRRWSGFLPCPVLSRRRCLLKQECRTNTGKEKSASSNDAKVNDKSHPNIRVILPCSFSPTRDPKVCPSTVQIPPPTM